MSTLFKYKLPTYKSLFLDFKKFKKQVEAAIKGGAAGFLAGRALWKDFNKRPKEEWGDFFKEVAVKRLKGLRELF